MSAQKASAKFQRQLSVEHVLEVALNAIDKPGADWPAAPERLLTRYAEGGSRAVVEEALSRARELVAQNPRDFVATGAVQLLSNALAQTGDR